MRVQLQVDAMNFQIDTRDPELLARWLGEIFTAITWTPATLVRAQAWPTWIPDGSPQGRADWIQDSRLLGQWEEIRSPQDFVDALQRKLNDLKGLKR